MPMPPQHLVDLARRAHAAGAPAHVLRGHVVAHVQREAAREEAVEHAMALVEALNETPGAPKVKLWTGLSSGAAPRVYFPEGYVTVGADGSIGGASVRAGSRGSLTFSEASLYPAQRRAYKKALDLYRAGLVERAEEQAMARADWIEELVEALGGAGGEDDEQLERQAERAAWQARHEEGRGNPQRAIRITLERAATAPEGTLLVALDGGAAFRKTGSGKTDWTPQMPSASSPDGWKDRPPPQGRPPRYGEVWQTMMRELKIAGLAEVVGEDD